MKTFSMGGRRVCFNPVWTKAVVLNENSILLLVGSSVHHDLPVFLGSSYYFCSYRMAYKVCPVLFKGDTGYIAQRNPSQTMLPLIVGIVGG